MEQPPDLLFRKVSPMLRSTWLDSSRRPLRLVPNRRQRSGVAAVEMALVAAFLLAPLLTGMFELSRALMAKETLCNAARKGCRTGILKQYGNINIFNDAVNIMRDNGYDNTLFSPLAPGATPQQGTTYLGSVTIIVTAPNGNPLAESLDAPSGSKVTVQVAIPVSSVLWTAATFTGANSLESDVIVMMKQ